MEVERAVGTNCFQILSTSRYAVITLLANGTSNYIIETPVDYNCKSSSCRVIANDSKSSDTHDGSHFGDMMDKITITKKDGQTIWTHFAERLSAFGCCRLRNIFSAESLGVGRGALLPIIKNLQRRYDRFSDEFEGINRDMIYFFLKNLISFLTSMYRYEHYHENGLSCTSVPCCSVIHHSYRVLEIAA